MTVAYTLVTVLLLSIALVFSLLAAYGVYTYGRLGESQYMEDARAITGSQFTAFFEAETLDQKGLQDALEPYCEQGVASEPIGGLFDSPQARILGNEPVFFSAADGQVLAACPGRGGLEIGQNFIPAPQSGAEAAYRSALRGSRQVWEISERLPEGGYRLYLPFGLPNRDEPIAVLVLPLARMPIVPIRHYTPLVTYLLPVVLLLMAIVTPFGAFFGLVMASGLSRRVQRMAAASDQWAAGKFEDLRVDKSADELGMLNRKMRSMAEKLQTLMLSSQEMATLEERNRLARDLHDTVKQQIFAAQMQLRAAQNLLTRDPGAARLQVLEAENLLKGAQDELGVLISALRPAQLEGTGLAEALRRFCADWSSSSKIPVDVYIQNERSLPIAQEEVLFRVAQEAFANILRHSHASRAGLWLDYMPAFTRMRIRDNGQGFAPGTPQGTGFGLGSMQTRLEELGGTFSINSQPGDTELVASLPYQGA